MIVAVYYNLGSISVDVDELSNARKFLNKCQEIIQKYQLKPEVVLVAQQLYNLLALLSADNDPQKAMEYITEAQNVYKHFKESGDVPVDTNDLFLANIETYNTEKALKTLEKNYTLTLYYLAQVYGALKDALRSSIYCHITLRRQLESNDYDSVDWALNAATLSQFFMEKNGFKQARHHLAASSCILDKHEVQLNEIVDHNEEYDSKMENFKHRGADVARCWAKYGLLLLATSKERLLNHADDIDENCQSSTDLLELQSNCLSDIITDEEYDLTFPTLDLSEYENQVTDKFLLTIQDAKKVFLNVQNWLNKAQEYYTLQNLASDYIEIVQDKSQLYASLAFFEDVPDNQAKLHKRRADLLEGVISEINPTYYLQYCRQIWFELAQIYSDILDIKMEKLQESNDRPTPHALSKVNSLVEKSIQHYSNFINAFKVLPTNELPPTVSEDFEKPFLQAHFHIAALYSRFIVLDKSIKLRNDEYSLEYYKKVTDYCDRNPKAQELISQELGISKQLVELLPLRIAKVKQELT